MKLKNKIRITKPYNGRSKFEFFQKIQANNIIELSLNLNPIGRSRSSGLYATMISMKYTPLGSNEILTFNGSITEISKYLSKMEYEELIL